MTSDQTPDESSNEVFSHHLQRTTAEIRRSWKRLLGTALVGVVVALAVSFALRGRKPETPVWHVELGEGFRKLITSWKYGWLSTNEIVALEVRSNFVVVRFLNMDSQTQSESLSVRIPEALPEGYDVGIKWSLSPDRKWIIAGVGYKLSFRLLVSMDARTNVCYPVSGGNGLPFWSNDNMHWIETFDNGNGLGLRMGSLTNRELVVLNGGPLPGWPLGIASTGEFLLYSQTPVYQNDFHLYRVRTDVSPIQATTNRVRLPRRSHIFWESFNPENDVFTFLRQDPSTLPLLKLKPMWPFLEAIRTGGKRAGFYSMSLSNLQVVDLNLPEHLDHSEARIAWYPDNPTISIVVNGIMYLIPVSPK